MPSGLHLPGVSKPFRFEEMWLSEKGCTDTVQAVWASDVPNDPSTKVIHKIEKCGVELKKWSQKHFGNVRKEIESKKKQLVQAEKEALRTGDNKRVKDLLIALNELTEKEGRMWLQRSKVLWAKMGDKNSKYFHLRATQRLRKNSIMSLRRADGLWCSGQDEVSTTIVDYYQELLKTTNPTNFEDTTQFISTTISEEMNAQLVAAFNTWEVQEAIKQMAPLKAPGPDGMPPLFYQTYWDLVGDEVTSSVLHFLNSASLPANLNHTFITLIPKVKNPEYVSEFRPISLCNVLYKIFSKVLANRLKRILPNIITEHQSAFTKSRLISDNI